MRLYVARSIGTGEEVVEPITPYVSLEGETITTRWYIDYKRPDCVLAGECKMTLVNWHNAERWVVVTNQNVAPAGTYDVGDPSNSTFMNATPSNPERNAIASFLGVTSNSLRNLTWRQLMSDALSHTTAWRALFTDGSEVWLKGSV